ncbi:hypothetical protein C4544_04375 [candidate division WS5 bacterium]|uniref:Uncharacterized protein n=1 Tax=candidate division WS5 bacterium TaxID=2093353 RepID=A0A419DCM8_9BACT|nr:MAG: hypothetical protein C4544_04375 [candidate division WS5 bacterium]
MEEINWKMFVAPIIILFVFIGGIIGIVNWQKSKKQGEAPPVSELTINIPEGETESRQKEFTVSGKTKEGEKVVVNGSEVQTEKDGSYAKVIMLNEGSNKVVVQSRKDGEVTETVERTVKYAAPAPASSAEQPQASVPQAPAAASPAPSNLATSGPEDIIIPVVGAGGVILAIVYWRKSRKTLSTSLRR